MKKNIFTGRFLTILILHLVLFWIYRPNSLLLVPGKILEKILFKQILPRLENSKIIPDHQFLLQKALFYHSAKCHHIASSFEQKDDYSASFLDVKQAFDQYGILGCFGSGRVSFVLRITTLSLNHTTLTINFR